MGGDDSQENLTPPISIELHAAFHKDLYDRFGLKEDHIAWQALSGRITSEEARLAAALEGQKKSEKYRNRDMKKHLDASRTKESCSRGGKTASKSLVEWIKNNKEEHRKNCSRNGKSVGEKLKIPHEYLGVFCDSKKSLQESTGLSNTGFYSKLRNGEITRLGRLIKTQE